MQWNTISLNDCGVVRAKKPPRGYPLHRSEDSSCCEMGQCHLRESVEGQRKGNRAEFEVAFQAMCFHLVFDVTSLSMVDVPGDAG